MMPPRRAALVAGRWAVALAVALSATARVQAQACAGDCDGDGVVLVNELVGGVNIALGNAELDTCAALDTDGDGSVGVAELVRAVRAATEGCEVALDGTCLQPGPAGLQPCTPDSIVRLLRCDDPATCLDDESGATVLDLGRVSASGAYSFSVPPRAIAGEIIILDTVVDPAAGTVYRVIDLGPAAAGVGAAQRRRLPPAEQTLERLIIDPSSEAAVRLIQECGLENLEPRHLPGITRAVRSANLSTDFSALTAAAAAELATLIARGDIGVQAAILSAKRAAGVTLRVTDAVARPGDIVEIAVLIRGGTDAPPVVGAENEIALDPRLTLLAQPDGTPDCALDFIFSLRGDRLGAFAFRPRGCTPGTTCTGLKAVVVNTNVGFPFVQAALLYTCRVRVAADASPGDAPIACSAARFSPWAPAPLPAPSAACTPGVVRVSSP